MGPNPGKSNSRKTYVAITNFTPTQAGELSLAEGDLVEGKGVDRLAVYLKNIVIKKNYLYLYENIENYLLLM